MRNRIILLLVLLSTFGSFITLWWYVGAISALIALYGFFALEKRLVLHLRTYQVLVIMKALSVIGCQIWLIDLCYSVTGIFPRFNLSLAFTEVSLTVGTAVLFQKYLTELAVGQSSIV